VMARPPRPLTPARGERRAGVHLLVLSLVGVCALAAPETALGRNTGVAKSVTQKSGGSKTTSAAKSTATSRAKSTAGSTATASAATGMISSDRRQTLLHQADLAFHGHRFAAAAELYRRAASLDEGAGDAPLMAAVAEFQLGRYVLARHDLDRATSLTMSAEDRDLARVYRDLLDEATTADSAAEENLAATATRDRAATNGFSASVVTSVGAGYDSNPNRSGVAQLDSDAAAGLRRGASFGTGSLELGIAGAPLPGLQLELDYSLDQSAQIDRGMADLDYQDHLLELTLRRKLSDGARVDVTLAGELSFMGFATQLHPFSNSARADVDLALGAGALRLRLGAGYQATQVLDPQLTFLGGHRIEVRATPSFDFSGWRLTGSARLREERLGTARSQPTLGVDVACDTCGVGTAVPYSNRSGSFSLRVKAPFGWLLRPGLWARIDGRSYDRQASIERSSGGTVIAETELGARATLTRAVGADLRLRIGESVSLTARWDMSRFVGVFRPTSALACAGYDVCGQGALADRQYDKQSLGLQLEIEWL
jgi:tetratricopeptide (TPR) repeat protein